MSALGVRKTENPYKDYEFKAPSSWHKGIENNGIGRMSHCSRPKEQCEIAKIPERCQTLENASKRGAVYSVIDFFLKCNHSTIQNFVPDKEEVIKLNTYREFIKENSLQIENMTHDAFSKFLYSHEPDLCVWMHNLSKEEKKDLESSCRVQYLTTYLDWCAVYYRIDNTAKLPETFFHWRDISSPDELEEACEMTSEDSLVDTTSSSRPRTTQIFSENPKIAQETLLSGNEDCIVRIQREGIKVKRLKAKVFCKKELDENIKRSFDYFRSVSDYSSKLEPDDRDAFISSCDNLQKILSKIFSTLKNSQPPS